MRSILLALALAVAAPAQSMFDVRFPAGCIATPCTWYGKPALMVVLNAKQPGSNILAQWNPGILSVFRTVFRAVAWHASDSRACTCGEFVYFNHFTGPFPTSTNVASMCWPAPGMVLDLAPKRTHSFQGSDQRGGALTMDYHGDGQAANRCNIGGATPFHPELICVVFEIGLR